MRTVLTFLAFASIAAAGYAADNKAPGKQGGDDRVICRREVPIGSLIATRKVCLTKTQWEERATRGNEEARKQMEDNAARNATPSAG